MIFQCHSFQILYSRKQTGQHKICGIVIVHVPDTVKKQARKFVTKKLKTEGLKIERLQRQKPSQISEFVYDMPDVVFYLFRCSLMFIIFQVLTDVDYFHIFRC